MMDERNIRMQNRYDELMHEGKHGHYETMFRVWKEEFDRMTISDQTTAPIPPEPTYWLGELVQEPSARVILWPAELPLPFFEGEIGFRTMHRLRGYETPPVAGDPFP